MFFKAFALMAASIAFTEIEKLEVSKMEQEFYRAQL